MVPKISIIVPVYKVEPYLDRCIRSLFDQTQTDLEIILVDDQSPDNCPAMCDKYAAEHENVQVVHKQNGGLGMACNSGLDRATGRYVAFLDSDDWVDPEMYRTMIDAAERHRAQLVFTGLRRVNEKGEKTPMSQASELRVYDTPEKVRDFKLGMIASEPSAKPERRVQMSAKVVLYDREFIEAHRIRFESERKLISEDLFFNLDNLARAGCVVELPETFYNYFVNSASLSQAIRTDRFDKSVVMRDELLQRYGTPSDEFRLRVDRMFIGYTRSALCQICLSPNLRFGEKRRLIKTICRNPLWQQIRRTYPIPKMPRIHKLFLQCILHRNFWLIYTFAKLKRG